jgi:hypothetical protein
VFWKKRRFDGGILMVKTWWNVSKRGEKMVLVWELKTCPLLEIFFCPEGFLPISGRTGRITRLQIQEHIAESRLTDAA